MNSCMSVNTKDLVRALNKYFRYSVLDGEFSALKKHLSEEKSLANKVIMKLDSACKEGHVDAMLAMGSLCKHLKKREDAIAYYKMAIAAGNVWAVNKLKKLSPKKDTTQSRAIANKTLEGDIGTTADDISKLIAERFANIKKDMLTTEEGSIERESLVKIFEGSCNDITKQLFESVRHLYDTTHKNLSQLKKCSLEKSSDCKKGLNEEESTPKPSAKIDTTERKGDLSTDADSTLIGKATLKDSREALLYLHEAVHLGHKMAATEFFRTIFSCKGRTLSKLYSQIRINALCIDVLLTTKSLHLTHIPACWRDFFIEYLAKSSIQELRIDRDGGSLLRRLPKTLTQLNLGHLTILSSEKLLMDSLNKQRFPKLRHVIANGKHFEPNA